MSVTETKGTALITGDEPVYRITRARPLFE
jgi:hypothetical protein